MLCFLFQFGLQQRNVKLTFTLFTHPRLIVTVYIYIRSIFYVIVVALCGIYTYPTSYIKPNGRREL